MRQDGFERSLQLSDFAVKDELEIIKNPYQFLHLPVDASPAQARASYVRLAKDFHPDLVQPSFDLGKISKLFTDDPEAKIRIIHTFTEEKDNSEERRKALEEIRQQAHRRMILVNRAYEQIKTRYNPEKWREIFGYQPDPKFNHKENTMYDQIFLEGRGQITLFTQPFKYWVAGPYLSFDFGPDFDHPWEDWGYRHSLPIKHLFANLERKEGKDVSPILLEPMADCYRLGSKKFTLMRELLRTKKTSKEIMEAMEIPNAWFILGEGWKSDQEKDQWLYNLRFCRHLNEILTLNVEPDWLDEFDELGVSAKETEGKLILKDYAKTEFTEADYLLFITLAYGPLLK